MVCIVPFLSLHPPTRQLGGIIFLLPRPKPRAPAAGPRPWAPGPWPRGPKPRAPGPRAPSHREKAREREIGHKAKDGEREQKRNNVGETNARRNRRAM